MKKLFISYFILLSGVAFGQNVGIGTPTPNTSALLHVDVGSSTTKGLLVKGLYDVFEINTIPDLGLGSRMMYYPGKGVFRAGYVDGNQWDNANAGDASSAMGYGTIAKGYCSTAMGFKTFAKDNYTTVMGSYTIADNLYSTAMGLSTYAGGYASTSMGYGTIAKGYASIVMGIFNDSILLNNEPSINPSTPLFIIGNGTTNLRSNAIVVLKNGNTGIGVSAPMSTLHVKGTANFFSGGNTRTGIVYNGTSSVNAIELVTSGTDAATADAYVSVQRSAGAGLHISKPLSYANPSLISFFVNKPSPGAPLEVGNITTNGTTTSYNTTSDKRLKENITNTHFGLSTIMKLNVKDYNYISDNKKALQTGLLAQELYAVYPQAVKAGGADAAANPWMVDYSKLTPVVVKAVQELSEENALLKNDILLLKKEMEQIKLILKKQNP